MTAQDCVLLIGAVAGGVATCLGAVGALWLRLNQHAAATAAQLQELTDAVNHRKLV